MEAYKLKPMWNREHAMAFIHLKAAITTEPVLKGPKWDGSPFVVTMDRCKDKFAGVLTQHFKTTLPNGQMVNKLHPIAFTSKQTSQTEEKYNPNCFYTCLNIICPWLCQIVLIKPIEDIRVRLVHLLTI